MDKTFLTVKELSAKLGVSEKTVYRMVTAGSIPFAIKIGGQWRFNADKIGKWVDETQNREAGRKKTDTGIRVVDALNNGLVIYRTSGRNRDEILDEVLQMVGGLSPEGITAIKKQILYRESIISSSLQGLSIMQPEVDNCYRIDKSMLLLAFLDKPMNLGAIDGTTTEAVLLLLAVNKTEQLILETRLARLLMEAEFIAMLKKQLNRRNLLERVATLEETLLN